MSGITPHRAAELIALDYEDGPLLARGYRMDFWGVQATILVEDGKHLLICRGTDEKDDWRSYNLRWFPMPDAGDTQRWHRGILKYSRAILHWLQGIEVAGQIKPEVVIGHSLGGAAAQIIAYDRRIPGVTFGSPRPVWGPRDDRVRSTPVVNWVLDYDPVTKAPPRFLGYGRVGQTQPLDGVGHGIKRYLDALPRPAA